MNEISPLSRVEEGLLCLTFGAMCRDGRNAERRQHTMFELCEHFGMTPGEGE
jgi:hypothetical protein